MIQLDGKIIKEEIYGKLRGIKLDGSLSLAVIQLDNDSNTYIRQKKRMAMELNIDFYLYDLINKSQEEILEVIDKINNDDKITGIIIQLPVPDYLDRNVILNAINPKKDIDCLTDINRDRLKRENPYIIPCTPKGIMYIFKYYNIDLNDKKIVILGRSIIVGEPLSYLLRDYDVTLCRSDTSDLLEQIKRADILITAIGNANYIKKDMIKEGVIIVDVGINRINNKLYGDVDYNSVKDKVSYITPVPGGVGPVTIAMIADNLYGVVKDNDS